MLKFYYQLAGISHVDPRINELEKDLEFYQFIFWGAIVIIVLLGILIYLQRISISGYRKGKEMKLMPRLLRKTGDTSEKTEAVLQARKSDAVSARVLPDPGLIFRFSLSPGDAAEKLITVGKTEGNIKTYSTEVRENHLSLEIRMLEREIQDLPEKIVEEYLIDLRREGTVLIHYPGQEGFREMSPRERLYIKPEGYETGDPVFSEIDSKMPVRLRIGERLNQEGRFTGGYFEFHLFTQDYGVTGKDNIPRIEKNFLLRLYKIYPGYDTGSLTPEGLYPMLAPFIADR